jgi:TATA-binding related factor (TRF) of subunit 20 of Mediator complex
MPSLVERLQKEYNAIGPNPFALEYRLYRSTNPADDKVSKEARWHHMLHMQYYPRQLFFRVFEYPNGVESSSVSSISDTHVNDYKTLMAQKMAALWAPRFTATIPKGSTFEIGDIIVRIGEVRADGTGQGVRAVIVAIQIPSEADMSKEDEAVPKDIILELWKSFGIERAKEAWAFGNELKVVKAWCNILKSR